MIPIPDICPSEKENQKPEILEEEDRPFPAGHAHAAPAQNIPDLIQLNDQKHSHAVDNFKNTTGKHILYGCLAVIVIAGIADAIWHIESPLFTSAFEVCKVMATTILGYFFGSKTK